MNRRMLTLIPIVSLVCVAHVVSPCYAESDHMKVVTKFFDVLGEQQSGPAIDYAFSTNPWASVQKAQITQLKLQYASLEPLVGKLQGYDVFINEVVADRYAYVLVLAAYEKQPVKIEIIMYKPADKWVVQNFLFNTDFVAEVKALAVSKLCEQDNLTTP